MTKLEEQFLKEKQKLEQIEVPTDLADRLRGALDQVPTRKPKKTFRPMVLTSAAILFLSLGTYHYSGLAYYGKQIIGYDEVSRETLTSLHEEGKGQVIDEQITLSDGTVVSFDAILSDENQFLLYYTLKNNSGVDLLSLDFDIRSVKGFLTESYHTSGVASANDDKTEVKAYAAFDPVNGFAKKLTLHYTEPTGQEGEFTFTYKADQALATTLKKSINQKIYVDKGHLTLDKILATPTETVITGSMDISNYDRLPTFHYDIQLYADGEPLEPLGSGTRTDLLGASFDWRFDALPKEVSSLELIVNKFVGYQQLDTFIPLNPLPSTVQMLESQELWIHGVEVKDGKTLVTIESDETVMLDQVSVQTNKGELVEIETTVDIVNKKTSTGDILKERTLVFATDKSVTDLYVGGVHYLKKYGEVVEIPIN